MIRFMLLLGFGLTATFGCAPLPDYLMTDVQSRREYRVHGQPNFMVGGGVSFIDQNTGSMVTLQSYEVRGVQGEQYQIGRNAWSGRDELKQVKR